MTPSVRADNRFRLQCPVVGREERYLACVLRRHRKWRGEPIDCGGCAAAMDANKCPAVHMIHLECHHPSGPRAIFFDPKGDKLYAVPKPVAERIERVLIMPFHARRYTMAPKLYQRLTGQERPAIPVGEEMPLGETQAVLARAPERREVRRGAGKGMKPAVQSKQEGDLSGILERAEIDMAAALNAAA